jgi:predicted RNA-binding protein with PUA-like domain
MNAWIVKTEPSTYSFTSMLGKKQVVWDGIRNHLAKRFLGEMKLNDVVWVYHSGTEKQIVGVATVVGQAYADPTATDGNWLAVNLRAICSLPEPLPLRALKAHPELQHLELIRQSRLSVTPVTEMQHNTLLIITGVVLPAQ